MDYNLDFNTLTGRTFSSVEKDDNSVTFYLEDGSFYRLKHHQDCCEHVWLEDVCGDLSDLEDSPILIAHEATSDNKEYDHGMWTFYHLSTHKGSVTLRFCGTSNGYYSVGVSLDYDDNNKQPQYVDTLADRFDKFNPDLSKKDMISMIFSYIPKDAQDGVFKGLMEIIDVE